MQLKLEISLYNSVQQTAAIKGYWTGENSIKEAQSSSSPQLCSTQQDTLSSGDFKTLMAILTDQTELIIRIRKGQLQTQHWTR